ncbi:hypothetical protein QUV93_07835, partial [Phascolarctobacterium faecium]
SFAFCFRFQQTRPHIRFFLGSCSVFKVLLMFDSFCSLQRFQHFVNYFFEIIFSNFSVPHHSVLLLY